MESISHSKASRWVQKKSHIGRLLKNHGLINIEEYINWYEAFWSDAKANPWGLRPKVDNIVEICDFHGPTHAFMLWFGAQGRILTCDRLFFMLDKSCCLCIIGIESLDHLFLDCCFSKELRTQVKNWMMIKYATATLSNDLKVFHMNAKSAFLNGCYKNMYMLNNLLILLIMFCLTMCLNCIKLYEIWSKDQENGMTFYLKFWLIMNLLLDP